MKAVKADISRPFYVVGGTMRHDAPSYVERRADKELFDALTRGEFCYVLTARQMGKSSLMIRTAARLRGAGVGVAVLDLTAVGQNLTAEQWYGGLVVQIGQQLYLEDELIEFWMSQPLLGPMQRWVKALRTVVMRKHTGRLVIFVDEIDAVRSLPFSTDEYFAGIRECYNQRSEDLDMERMTFCMSGVATPSDLIRDTRTTPFNIGHRIELHDFTEREAAPLVNGLRCEQKQGAAILKRIFHWTGGHPYLTQRLCLAVSEEKTIPGDDRIDSLCEVLFCSKRAQERDDNLLFVRERMLRSEADLSGLLDLYARVRRRKAVLDDQTSKLVSILRLSGITRTEGGRLKVRNRIYERVFDLAWVAAHMPDAEVRRQRAAYRRGVWRTAIISTLILALFGWLALTAIKQRGLAEQHAKINQHLEYFARITQAQQELENSNVDRVEELLRSITPHQGEYDLRGFEWHLLLRLAHGEVASLPKVNNKIASVTFLNDGHTLVVGEALRAKKEGDDEYLIKFYDWKEGRDVSSFNIPAGRNFDLVVFSPDKRRVAVDGPEKEVHLWDIHSRQRIAAYKGHSEAIAAIAFSPDGRYLASADLDGVIKLWDTTTGARKFSIKRRKNRVWGMAFSPEGRLLVTTHETEVVKAWDAATGRELKPFTARKSKLARATFSPDGRRLVASAADGKLIFWNVRTRRIISTLTGHAREVRPISFFTDGKIMATGSLDRTVRLWDAVRMKEIALIQSHGSEVSSIAWSPDGKYLVTGSLDGTVKRWDATRREIIPPADAVAQYFATSFSEAGELIALGAVKDSVIKLWNLSNGRKLARFDEPGDDVICAAFSRDNKLVATGGFDSLVKIWDVATGRQIHTLKGHKGYVLGVNFSPNGSRLISGSKDNALIIWDVASGHEIARFEDGVDHYYRAVFSPDGEIVASACRDGSVKLWEVNTRTVIKTLVGHTDHVRAIAFSPDGRLLATGGKDNTIRLWEVATGLELKKSVQSDYVQRAAFSSGGMRLVTGSVDGSVKLWDVTTWHELMNLKGHKGEVTSVTFSDDYMSLATSSKDGTVRLWRAEPVQ
jgi:WD40 repeat protein